MAMTHSHAMLVLLGKPPNLGRQMSSEIKSLAQLIGFLEDCRTFFADRDIAAENVTVNVITSRYDSNSILDTDYMLSPIPTIDLVIS